MSDEPIQPEPTPGGEDAAGASPAPASGGEDAPSAVPRRTFLELAGAGLGACVGAGVLGIGGAAVLGTSFSGSDAQDAWVSLGALARFPDGEPLKVPVLGELQDAWNRFPARTLGNVVVVRAGESARAFSATCPHNGCDVFVAAPKLICPCHDSSFSPYGEVEAGPSPRALDELDVRLEEGDVWVRFQRFEVGVAEKRSV